MKWLLFFLFTLMAKTSFGQGSRLFNSTEEVAGFMVLKHQKEDDRIKGIYDWVISNFSYDANNTFAINAGPDPTAKITIAFQRRRGVCDNISAIFNDICLKSGITSFVVSGYTRQGNLVDKSGHSWTAASINNHWYLFDPTWDLGRMFITQYFMASPEDFIVTHMPFDPLWQLLDYPITHQQFSGRGNDSKQIAYFNYPDSITALSTMDSLQKLQSAASRIERNGLYNDRIKANYGVIKMNIEIAHQESVVELYNSALEDLNEIANTLNQFIEYRNKQFIPLKPDRELKELLNGVDEKINSSLNNLDQIDKSEAKLVLSTERERQRISLLIPKIKNQKIFLNKYLTTGLAERPSLFYEKK